MEAEIAVLQNMELALDPDEILADFTGQAFDNSSNGIMRIVAGDM